MDDQESIRADIRRYKSLSMMTSDAAATRVLDDLIAEAEALLWRLDHKATCEIVDLATRRDAQGAR